MKITKPAGTELAPRLKDVLELVYAKRPLLEYEAAGNNRNGELCAVTAWQDGQLIGRIDAEFRKYSPTKGTNEIWYSLTCDNIRKQRGSRNTKFVSSAKTAAKDVIELFTKKPLFALGARLIDEVKHVVSGLEERVHSNYRNSIAFVASELTNYFIDIYEGKTPAIPQKIADQIVSKDMLRKRDNVLIAENVIKHMKNGNGYCIKVMKDESLLFAHMGDSMTTSKCASTYELDQYSQEKITMLKLLEPNQFAADIGIKYETDNGEEKSMCYFIVAGETITH